MKQSLVLTVLLWLAALLRLPYPSAARPNGEGVFSHDNQIQQEKGGLSRQSTWQPSVVHFVPTCHLDVGFADLAANIVNR